MIPFYRGGCGWRDEYLFYPQRLALRARLKEDSNG